MVWLIVMVMLWIKSMCTIQERLVKAQTSMNKKRICGLGAEGSEVHFYFFIYV